jgi:hypothetical protein
MNRDTPGWFNKGTIQYVTGLLRTGRDKKVENDRSAFELNTFSPFLQHHKRRTSQELVLAPSSLVWFLHILLQNFQFPLLSLRR